MLQPNQQTDLQVLYYLSKRKYSVQKLATLLAITPRKLRQRVASINEILSVTEHLTDVLNISESGIIRLNPQLKARGLLVFYHFKLDLLKRDYEFRILSMLTTRERTTPAQLCQALFISKSYLYRLIKTVNANLLSLNIHIKITNNAVSLEGDEIMVRILAFMMNTDAFQSLEWPYVGFSEQDVMTSLPSELDTPLAHMSVTKRTFLSHLFAIIATRLNGGHRIHLRGDAHLRELLELIISNYDVTHNFNPSHFKDAPADEVYAERLYLNLLSRIYLSDFYSEANKIALGKTFRNSDIYFTNLARNLTDSLTANLHLKFSEKVEDVLTYFITIGLAYYHLLGGQTGKLNDYIFMIKDNRAAAPSPKTEEIAAVLHDFIHDNHLSILASADAEFIATNFITTVLAITVTPKVNVYLQSVRDYTAYTLLATMIRRVFNEENVEITTDIAQADLIITDSFEAGCPQADVYFFDDLQQHWPGILQAINDRILKKLFDVPKESTLLKPITA